RVHRGKAPLGDAGCSGGLALSHLGILSWRRWRFQTQPSAPAPVPPVRSQNCERITGTWVTTVTILHTDGSRRAARRRGPAAALPVAYRRDRCPVRGCPAA